ncbi:MAG: hypothetical protein CFE21_14095 [Bacteroidetes bacterium B1(2017)]|nr:MAG: hypothetical protein CFE21_14095 [Bacteroidetes bacterium B1(2017)]
MHLVVCKTMKQRLFFVLIIVCNFCKAQVVYEGMPKTYTRNWSEYWVDCHELGLNQLVFIGSAERKADSLQYLLLAKTTYAGGKMDSISLPLSKDSSFTIAGSVLQAGKIVVYGFAGKVVPSQLKLVQPVLYCWYFSFNLTYLGSSSQVLPISLPYTINRMHGKINMQQQLFGAIGIDLLATPNRLTPRQNVYFVLDSESKMNSFRLDTLWYGRRSDTLFSLYLDFYSTELSQLSETKYMGYRVDNWLYYHTVGVRFEIPRVLNEDLNDLNYPSPTCFVDDNNNCNPAYTRFLGPYNTVLPILGDSSSFYVAGVRFKDPNHTQQFFVALNTLNSDTLLPENRVENKKVIGFENSYWHCYPAYLRCLDRFNNGSMVFAGMIDQKNEEFNFPPVPKADTLFFAWISKDLGLIKSKRYFNNQNVSLLSITPLSDGSVVGVGYTHNYINDSQNLSRDFFAIRLDANGNVLNGLTQGQEVKEKSLVYPNPFTDLITIESEFEIEKLELINEFGQVVATQIGAIKQATIQTQDIPKGIYFLTVLHTNSRSQHKLLLKI